MRIHVKSFSARHVRTVLVGCVALLLVGCETMRESEMGIRFRRIPPSVGGGIDPQVIPPGKTIFVVPGVDAIYRFTTVDQVVAWGPEADEGLVYTRSRDGNEVALAIRIQYRIMRDGAALERLLTTVARSDEEVRQLVLVTGRSFIRTHMNRLRTSEYLERASLDAAVKQVESSMRERLAPFGIEVVRVIFDRFLFERLLPNGSTDARYAERLQEINQTREDTERERARIKTVEAEKLRELNDMQARVNRMIEEAEGYRKQAEIRGTGYQGAKKNEADAIRATGEAEVKGLREQLKALDGSGGTAIVRMELAKRLAQADPRFILLQNGGNSLDLQRLDTNALLATLGVVEGAVQQTPRTTTPSKPPTP